MDRVTTYALAGARAQDFLQAQRNTMSAIAYLAQATIGGNTGVAGLALTPTSPASLNVNLSPGSIYQIEQVEATAWSSLPATSGEWILKQGILNFPYTITLAPPTTVGYSQVFLIEVQYADSDTDPVLLSYYNASNPSAPYQGPGGSGVSQSTARRGLCAVQIKAGTAAAAGSQVAPLPDAGWTALWYVTLSYGQTTVTSGDIWTYGPGFPSSPWFPTLESLSDYYVRKTPATTYVVNCSTGSDTTGTGSSINPWRTIQYAIDTIGEYSFGTQSVTIQMQVAGTYDGPIRVSATSGGTLYIRGSILAQDNFIIAGNSPIHSAMVVVTGGASAALVGLTLSCQNSGEVSNLLVSDAVCTVQNVTFAGVSGTAIAMGAPQRGTINVSDGVVFAQSVGSALSSKNGSTIIINGTMTTRGTIAWTTACAMAENNGSIALGVSGVTFTDTGATGKRYDCTINGIINTSGGGANFFPGNAAGTTATGGQYI